MKYTIHLRLVITILLLFRGVEGKSQSSSEHPNILLICVDDLRPELGCYGHPYIHSPNLDRLAREGYLFRQHFVTVPTCGASRHSMLTGRLPRTRDDLSNAATVRALTGRPEPERPETLMHHLRRNGYHTVGIGKISHHPDGRVYEYTAPVSKVIELPYSWDELLFDYGKWGTGHNAFFGYADGTNRNTLNNQVKPYEHAAVEDKGYPDGVIAEIAVEKLQELKSNSQPFFLGVGFFKPHLPFNAPQRYWDRYDASEIPISPNGELPEQVHEASLHGSGEFNRYELGEEKASLDKPLSDAYARKLRHGYAACVSYVDAQIGKVLDALRRLELEDNTIVVVWGDHGWHLGDHLVWGKHTILERALHSVLMIRVPGTSSGVIPQVVSSVDIYPTLMELCQLPMPYETKGRSLIPLMKDPDDEDWEEAAYSYFREGISLRTVRYRLNRYFRDELPSVELFDHQEDPNETRNIASEREDIVNQLMPLWEKGNTGLYVEQTN